MTEPTRQEETVQRDRADNLRRDDTVVPDNGSHPTDSRSDTGNTVGWDGSRRVTEDIFGNRWVGS